VVVTASLLPLELFEIARKVNGVRIGILAINLAILAYLIVRLRLERQADLAASRV
jgi:uncharacterized membrane protein (DUF2068 family)